MKAKNRMFSGEELHARIGKIEYPGEAKEAAFPLGGIGTGNVSVGARGELRDWEIFGWPGKKNFLPFTFFALWAKKGDAAPVARILEREITPHYNNSRAFFPNGALAGLPRFRLSRLRAGYPFVEVELEDADVPLEVSMEAFTPMIPLNAEDSGIPGAVIRYRLCNPHAEAVRTSVVGTMANVVGFDGYNVFNNVRLKGEGRNEEMTTDILSGLRFTSPDIPADSFDHGSLAIGTTSGDGVFRRAEWLKGQWTDNAQDFWDDFRADGKLDPVREVTATGSEHWEFHVSVVTLHEKFGSVGVHREIPAHGETTIEFVIGWHFPNRPKGWIELDQDIADFKAGKYGGIRNHYATLHDDAWAAATYLAANMERLESQSRAFENALYNTELPTHVIDAVAANIASMRSHCTFRIETGEFLGWEGTRDHVGSGHGSVNHVWNFVQTVAFLFPELERSMRRVEFNLECDATGRLPFRARRIMGQDERQTIPAADGQLGAILRVWREWKISGDDEFLSAVWNGTRLAMEFSISYWDPDGDGLLEKQQSNTYDIEFYGSNPMMSFVYCGALKGCSEMAEYMGDTEASKRYAELARASSRGIEDLLWDGDYFVQRIDDVNAHRYQHGIGCHSDQLLGQFMAYVAGMGPLVDESKIRSAIKSVFEYNFLPELRALQSVQRAYALNDEAGLVLCTWPRGGRPRFPFAYCDEVWTGVEYQVATNLVHAGLIDEALTLVKALRSRYDGFKRNPWSELEAGHHYVRSMASFGLITAFSGQRTDLVKGTLRFAPRLSPDGGYRTFWICGRAWGTIEFRRAADGTLLHDVTVLYGSLEGISVIVEDPLGPAS